MVKNSKIIVIFSLISGALAWIIDAVIDSYVFSKGSFWSVLTTNDNQELYTRSLFLVSIVLFGVLIARFVGRRQQLENAAHAIERSLDENERRLHSVMESIADSIYLIDSSYRYLFMNKRHIERLGLTASGYIGRAYSDLHSIEETEELIENVDQVFATGETIRKEHFSSRDNRYFLRTFSPVRNGEGQVFAVTVVSKDVNDLKQMEEELRSLSITDELTGLYNRRGFFTMAEPQLKFSDRNKTPVFLLYADLDNLKEINDVLGHHEGDRAIKDTAMVLKETFRASDIIARMGGDEFVVIPVAGKREDADIVVARLRRQVTESNEKNKRPYRLSISVGMSFYDPASPKSIDDLLKQAEKLMYQDKVLKQKAG